MERKSKILRFFKKNLTVILLASVCALYLGRHIYFKFHRYIKTEIAEYACLSDILEADGVIIRDEEIIPENKNGSLTYMVGDGERIHKDGTIAEIYLSESDISSQNEINSINRDIECLKKLNCPKETFSKNTDLLDRQIHLKINQLNSQVNNFGGIQINNRNDLLSGINERQIVAGKRLDFSSKIQDLENRKNTLSKNMNKSIGEIISPCSGYFIKYLDGYENLADYKSIKNLKPTDIDIDSVSSRLNNNETSGKIVKSSDWYIALNIPSDKASKLHINDYITAQILDVSFKKIPCKVEAINHDSALSKCMIVVSCSYIDRDFLMIRKSNVKLCLSTNSGIKISKSSLHESLIKKETEENGHMVTVEKTVKGVYVKYGNNLTFKEAVPIYSDSENIICEQFPPSDSIFSGKTLQVNDEVVAGGVELFDGKCIK